MGRNTPATFVDRRGTRGEKPSSEAERRQFAENREALDPDVRELAEAIDAYKLAHHRRFITLGEVVLIVKSLGYHK